MLVVLVLVQVSIIQLQLVVLVNYVCDGRQVNMNGGNQGATINADANLTAKCAAITSDIQTLSTKLAQLANVTGNNVSIPTSQSGALNFLCQCHRGTVMV